MLEKSSRTPLGVPILISCPRRSLSIWACAAHSATTQCRGSDNVAKGYMAFDDASPCHVACPHMAEDTLMNPAGGIQSSANDRLRYYMALGKALNDQQQTGKTSTLGSPLKHWSRYSAAASARHRAFAKRVTPLAGREHSFPACFATHLATRQPCRKCPSSAIPSTLDSFSIITEC